MRRVSLNWGVRFEEKISTGGKFEFENWKSSKKLAEENKIVIREFSSAFRKLVSFPNEMSSG